MYGNEKIVALQLLANFGVLKIVLTEQKFAETVILKNKTFYGDGIKKFALSLTRQKAKIDKVSFAQITIVYSKVAMQRFF